jgi:hypothetical protein
MCLSLYPAVQERALRRLARVSYVLLPEEREAMLAAQGGTCANPVCSLGDDGKSRWTRLAIDHDHTAGPDGVRGLLCWRCNVSVGMSPGDRLEGVLGLAVYLARHERPDIVPELDAVLNGVRPQVSFGDL